jgi:hypothetical protein
MSWTRLQKSAGVVAAEIEMSRLNWGGAFTVVEGVSDSRFWDCRRAVSCEIVIATGRPQVLGALKILNQRHCLGVVGVVDDDFDTLTQQVHGIANVINTDPRDIEGILLRSSALEKVLAEFGDTEKIRDFLEIEPPTIRDALLRRAEIFGRIRWANLLNASATIDALKPQRFCDRGTWSYDTAQIKREAIKLGVAPDLIALDAMLAILPNAPSWHVCRGHDLVDVLVGGLLGAIGRGTADQRAVEATLRAGLEDVEFRGTHLWREMTSWELANRGFHVLRR